MNRRRVIQSVIGFVAAVCAFWRPKEAAAHRDENRTTRMLFDKDGVQRPALYADAGEWVTCENGHKIARFAREVRYGKRFDPADLTEWQQPEPKIGDMRPKCARCEARFCAGTQFHFAGGWRV